MEKTRIGKVAPAPKGVYDSGTAYDRLDIVTNSDSTVLYMSKQDGNTGHALDDGEWWMKCIDADYIREVGDVLDVINGKEV